MRVRNPSAGEAARAVDVGADDAVVVVLDVDQHTRRLVGEAREQERVDLGVVAPCPPAGDHRELVVPEVVLLVVALVAAQGDRAFGHERVRRVRPHARRPHRRELADRDRLAARVRDDAVELDAVVASPSAPRP